MNMPHPKRLKKGNPLIDAVAEVRFESRVPPDTVVGLVYGTIRSEFGKPEGLPILQLPPGLRDTDTNLRYQATHKFHNSSHTILLGPRTFALSTKPYEDWNSMAPKLSELLKSLDGAGLFEKVERIGLRYINFFEKVNIVEHSTLSLEISGSSIAKHGISLRTERRDRDFMIVTQISNQATLQETPPRSGSIFDIDISRESPTIEPKTLPEELIRIFSDANSVADDAFFDLLDTDFLAQFEPEY